MPTDLTFSYCTYTPQPEAAPKIPPQLGLSDDPLSVLPSAG